MPSSQKRGIRYPLEILEKDVTYKGKYIQDDDSVIVYFRSKKRSARVHAQVPVVVALLVLEEMILEENVT